MPVFLADLSHNARMPHHATAPRSRIALAPRLRSAVLTLALSLAGAASAQVVAPPLPVAPVTPSSSTASAPPSTDSAVLITPGEPPVPLLWKVSDADNAVYLLGSFHMLKPDDYPLSGDVNAAFAEAKTLVFEMPPSEMASPQLGVQMAQAALRTDGTTLDSQLPPATRAKLAAWLAKNAPRLQASGLTPHALQGFEPWFVGLLVTITGMSGQGFEATLGVDRHFMEAAASDGKRTDGFESGPQQIAFLDGMSPKEQLQMLDEALSEPEPGAVAPTPPVVTSAPSSEASSTKSPAASTAGTSESTTATVATGTPATPAPAPPVDVETLHAAWRAGDADGLWNGMGQQLRATYPDLYRRINVERNDAWLPKVEAMLSTPGTDDTLVVVGALHLLGSDGLVDKLRARGYAVERICSACAVAAPVPAVAEPVTPAASDAPPSDALPAEASPVAPTRESPPRQR